MGYKSPNLEEQKKLCLRPEERRHVLYQSWEKLLFLHWEIDPAEIQKTLPEGLYVDTFDGRAFVGVVPFYMRNIRPRYLPAVPWLSFFLEMNVRTYVHDENGIPAVWFYSLDTNQPLATYLGRRFFNMPYTDAKMKAERQENGAIHYQCQRKGRPDSEKTGFIYRGISEPRHAEAGSIEFFLAERYLLFCENPKNGNLFSGRVYHTPYPLQEVELTQFSNIPIKQAGFPGVTGEPVHAAYTDGVDVMVFPLERLQQ